MTVRLLMLLVGLLGGPASTRSAASPGRRGFLQRAALVATALAVDPVGFILRPRSAYASVCGPANECSQGWTAMCCTINGGANTCPEGSYAAGWWKVSSSAFCRGEDRYVVDCNRLPDAQCQCHCADGECDRRRVCCNNFRYGQCNQQIAGVTEVVCRIIICTPPWEWDESCTTTVRTDERTREHSASCLPGTDPTEIEVAYLDLGLVGSVLGAPVGAESPTDGGGSWRPYERGAITAADPWGVQVAAGAAGVAYRESGGPEGPLGHLTGPVLEVAGGAVAPAERGATYAAPDGTTAVLAGIIQQEYARRGGPAHWLGFPLSDTVPAPGDRERADFASGWSLVGVPSTGEVRLLPSDVALSARPEEWPPTGGATRWAGPDRIATATRISQEAHPDGAGFAVLVGAGALADALGGGVLAGVRGGPVLLTDSAALSALTAEELRRLDPAEVVLAGGRTVLSEQVLERVQAVLPDTLVRRVEGEDRFATAVALAEEVARSAERGAPSAEQGASPAEASRSRAGLGGGQGSLVVLANGRTLVDALAASPVAALREAPLLLTEAELLPAVTRRALERFAPDRLLIVGGPAAVTEAVAEEAARAAPGAEVVRVHGDGRVETAARLATGYGVEDPSAVLLSAGDGLPDALAAGAAAATTGSGLLLADSTGLPAATREAIAELGPSLLVAIGGRASLGDVVLEQLAATPVAPYERRTPPGSAGEAENGPVSPPPALPERHP